MKIQKIKFKNKKDKYSIEIGKNILRMLPKKIKAICPQTKKIALIFDTGVPLNYKKTISNYLKKYELSIFSFSANERIKNLKSVDYFLNKLLSKNFNRTDLVIGIGGGITGDLTGFVSSIYKRGINFINIPTHIIIY